MQMGEVKLMVSSIEPSQIITWMVLFFVLYSVITDKIPFDIAAFGGLLLLGLLKVSTPKELFSGFADTSVFVVAAVMILSAGIVESGILNGLGRFIAQKVECPKKQIFSISLVTGMVSAFMNNVGAIGLMLPTAKRMASRAGVHKATFGLPMVYATILGGAMTLIGCSPNIIISTFRYQSFGKPFRMFDFAAHGLTMLGSAVLLWFIAQTLGFSPLDRRCVKGCNVKAGKREEAREIPVDVPTGERNRRKSSIVLFTFVPVVILAGLGFVHSSIGFGFAAILFILLGVITREKAYSELRIPTLVFLGSMVSIATILENTGSLAMLIDPVSKLVERLPHILSIIVFVFVSAFLANILDNSVAAVLMSPTAILLTQSPLVSVSPDALLMAVSAGASLGVILPTEQTTVLAMTETDISAKRLMQQGTVVALFAGVMASLVIYLVWA